MNLTEVKFNGVDLNAVVDVYNLDVNRYPDFEIREYKIARANLSVITSKEAVSKDLFVYGKLCSATRAQTELLFAVLKLIVFGVNGQLEVTQAGQKINYTATCEELNQRWVGTNMMIEMKFVASDPYGYAQATQLPITTITTATATKDLAVASTVTIQPRITLNLDSVTDGTGKQITLRNGLTNVGITINEDFTTGDSLHIDSQNLIILLNGSPVDFTGVFPTFEPSIGSILGATIPLLYTDTFTARSVTGTFEYNLRV